MATNCYFEERGPSKRGENSATADVMRHLHTRQHLGKAVIVCDQPPASLGAARKQWLKLSRSIQKQRSSTLNADKILKYTHAVTRMQRMYFSAKTPLERPEADVYFLKPEELEVIPTNCWTVYMLAPADPKTILRLVYSLPDDSLIVDYIQTTRWPDLGLQPKKELEDRVHHEWRQVQQFLKTYEIDVTKLIVDGIHDVESMDDALDTLLGGHSHEFLQVAGSFQHALELARPIRLNKSTRTAYDSLILLAHRVQALTPSAFSQQFLEVYNEDDSFFLYDSAGNHKNAPAEALAEAFRRHTAAGRHHLARHLHLLAQTR